MYQRRIICLAKSRKTDGLCIAGKEFDGARAGQWVRPVSSRPDGEVSQNECAYDSGDHVQLLDLVAVPLKNQTPNGHQIENHTLDEGYCWAKEGTATWDQVMAHIDPYDAGFWVQGESTYYGLNDKVSDTVAAAIGSSLKLIVPDDLRIHVAVEPGFEGRPPRKRVRASFDYQEQPYKLSVTDIEIEEHYLQQAEGTYPIDTAILCISLVEPWNGYAFRVIASLITPDRFAE